MVPLWMKVERWSASVPLHTFHTIRPMSRKLQQDRNAHPPTLRAVGEERLLGLEQRPVLDQFLLAPASFHRAATYLS